MESLGIYNAWSCSYTGWDGVKKDCGSGFKFTSSGGGGEKSLSEKSPEPFGETRRKN